MSTELVESEGRDLSLQEKGMVDVEVARAVAQIQGAMTIAKKFPRDEKLAITKIKDAAQRRRVAESAEYEYVRGGSKISGPSIRAMEVVSQAWGNMNQGIVEVNRDPIKGESLVMAYAVDLETNNWKHVTFTVPHTRDTKAGSKRLTEGRDVYERVMNDGSRRLRNCLQAVIPSDVVDEFMDEANKTLSKDERPLAERQKIALQAMESLQVTRAMIEITYGCKVEALSERQIAELRRRYQSIKDGFGKVEDYFKVPVNHGGQAKDLNKAVKAGAIKPEEPKEEGAFGAFQGSSVAE